jgi:carbon storage regulator
VRIGPDIKVTVVASNGGQVRIAIEAPEEVGIFREEIFERVAAANVEAASVTESMLGGLETARGMDGGQVRIAIDAPEEVGIFREEIFERVAAANVEAASVTESMLGGLEAARGIMGRKAGGEIDE